jgi:hypothetical protein
MENLNTNPSSTTNKEVNAVTAVSRQTDISKNSGVNILTEVKNRSEKATRLRNEQKERGIIPTDFEKTLFADNTVDFESYIECNALFKIFNEEALGSVDVRYANYQQSLLHLLQHCYGYFYALKSDSERYEKDIKYINSAIAASNLRSNKGNSLSSKIVKLAWKGSEVDRRKLSSYSKLLDNAWCKSRTNHHTDKNGAVLPKHFSEDVMDHGGISSYSRMSAAYLKKQKDLEAEGYECLGDKQIDLMRDAIQREAFTYADQTIKLTCSPRLPSDNNFSQELRDGDRICALLKWDLDNSEFRVVETYNEGDKDGVVDKVELALYNKLKKRCLEMK